MPADTEGSDAHISERETSLNETPNPQPHGNVKNGGRPRRAQSTDNLSTLGFR